MKKILIVLLLLLLFIGCDEKTNEKQTLNRVDLQEKQKSISKFVLETINGEKLHIKEIDNGLEFKEKKGKVLFLVLFGYRCPPCLQEIPSFIELDREHKDLEIVAIEVQGYDSGELKSFAQNKGINYTLISSDNHMEFIRYIQKRANWSGGIPFIIGLNKKGKVIIMHTGGVEKSTLEGAYQDLIKS